MIHILRRKNDYYIDFWCPYCDEIHPFGFQEWYEDCVCSNCKRVFSSDFRHHNWPKGIDIKTGELEQEEQGK